MKQHKKLLRYFDLVGMGLVNNRTGVARLVANAGFPPGFKLGAGGSNATRYWFEDDVVAWLEAQKALSNG